MAEKPEGLLLCMSEAYRAALMKNDIASLKWIERALGEIPPVVGPHVSQCEQPTWLNQYLDATMPDTWHYLFGKTTAVEINKISYWNALFDSVSYRILASFQRQSTFGEFLHDRLDEMTRMDTEVRAQAMERIGREMMRREHAGINHAENTILGRSDEWKYPEYALMLVKNMPSPPLKNVGLFHEGRDLTYEIKKAMAAKRLNYIHLYLDD